MTTQTEALKLAIEVFGGGDWHDEIVDTDWADKANNAITVLREALAEQPAQQEPVAKVYRHGKASNGEPWHGVHWFDEGVNMPDGTLLYTAAQPAREWVGLTHEEIDYQAKKDDHAVYFALGALWAEAKLKEKNT